MAGTSAYPCLSHDLIINALFNHLTRKGCNVYIEPTIPAPSVPTPRPIIEEDGSLVLRASRRLKGRIDLVAVCDGTVIGYEVKCSVNDIPKALSVALAS